MRTFMYIDDDIFDKDNIRKPKVYYPIIGAQNILEKMNTFDKHEFFTTVEGAIDWMEKNGCPHFISFDNDLRRNLEGKDLVKWITEKDMDMEYKFIPDDFEFFVHSQNIEAKKAINSLLGDYLEFSRREKQKLPKMKI